MKMFLKIFTLFFFINFSANSICDQAHAQSVTFQAFYDDLSPHGSWFESPDYGYVWRPSMTSGFTPYSSNGYWIMTEAGWTWISDYSWGWAPFHYGRWYNDPFYGYVWVPGYEWGPGWVTWRRSNDYYGWAPIGPGVNLDMAYSNSYRIPYNQWNFVSCQHFGQRDIHNYYIDRTRNTTIINNTTVINNVIVDKSRNTTYNTGPDRLEVQRKVKRTINPVSIVDEQKPSQQVSKNSIRLYRPLVQNNLTDAKPAPAKIIAPEELKISKGSNTTRPVRYPPIKMNSTPVSPVDQQQANMNAPVKETVRPVKHPPIRRDDNLNDPISVEQPKQEIKQPIPQQPIPRIRNNDVPKQTSVQPNIQREPPRTREERIPEPKNMNGSLNHEPVQQSQPRAMPRENINHSVMPKPVQQPRPQSMPRQSKP